MKIINFICTIFTINYILFIGARELGSNRHVNALAGDNIAQKQKYKSVSSQAKLNLQIGKVVLQGEKGDYLGRVLTEGNIGSAWEVLTDYNNFERFLPNITSSKIIEQSGNNLVFEQTNIVDLWLFQQEFTVQIEAVKHKPTHVDFKIVDGDLKKLIGRWEIAETAPGQVLVSHKVEVEPGSDTEKPFFYGVYESSLEETLDAIALEITRRSQ